jgi:hypothetical protein
MKQIIIALFMTSLPFLADSQSLYDSYKPTNSTVVPTYQPIDTDFYLKVLEMKKRQFEALERERKEKAQATIKQTKEIYKTFESFPETITDGWYNVTVTNNFDFCEERKVYIEDQTVKKYIVDNWKEIPVAFSGKIEKAKVIVKMQNDYLDIYFLETTINPAKPQTRPPLNPGKIGFWTDYRKSGNVDLYVDGEFIGTLKSYFEEGEPNCEQEGVITFTYKPGTYNFEAKSEKLTWSGKITIYENQCVKQKLNK